MFTSLIIEDEKPAARRLQRLLLKEGIAVPVLLHSVAEAVRWLQNNPEPDLIFLDIQLSDGLSFEIFEKVDITSAIIFTTAYDQYALKAFKLNSIDYLLKPIDTEELHHAIIQFKQRFKSQNTVSIDSQLLKSLLSDKKSYKKRFMVQIGQHLKMINVAQIECFFSENKATYAYVSDGKTALLDDSLERIAKTLDPELFFQVNRKCIIHIKAIKDIISYTNSRLQIKLTTFNQHEIIVSRERVKAFKNWLA